MNAITFYRISKALLREQVSFRAQKKKQRLLTQIIIRLTFQTVCRVLKEK